SNRALIRTTRVRELSIAYSDSTILMRSRLPHPTQIVTRSGSCTCGTKPLRKLGSQSLKKTPYGVACVQRSLLSPGDSTTARAARMATRDVLLNVGSFLLGLARGDQWGSAAGGVLQVGNENDGHGTGPLAGLGGIVRQRPNGRSAHDAVH